MFEHRPKSLKDLESLLGTHGVSEALIKPLSRNHNDKNQIYSGRGFAPLYPTFDVAFSLRGPSASGKKSSVSRGKPIPEAVFRNFVWIDASGREIPAHGVKMIIYAQYPETRLSGFSTIENTMPHSLSVEFTKLNPNVPRYLVLGRRNAGDAVAVVVVDPSQSFMNEIDALPSASGSRMWKHLKLKTGRSGRLVALLDRTVCKKIPGRRLDKSRSTLPFNGTQVCGYTLEHELGIVPNSDSKGDFEGIELKAHTQRKVTLFTPEPDMGLYAADFKKFMTTYGYLDNDNNYRVTGIHRVGERCSKSGLTLKVINHDRSETLAASADRDVHIGLFDDGNQFAAGWSLERMLNCWTSKHNEAVYIPATRTRCDNPELRAAGYQSFVEFSDQVLWCRQTSAEQLFESLYNGTLFLDPAPKYCPTDAKLNKRRSQWRVNDIFTAARDLYTDVRPVKLRQGVQD